MKWLLSILPKEACTLVLECGLSQHSWFQCPGGGHAGCDVDIASAAASRQGVWVFRWPLEHTAHMLCVLSSIGSRTGLACEERAP